MAALDYLVERGLIARLKGSRVNVKPKERITDEIRIFIKMHRLSLLSELAANDGIEYRMYWNVIRGGKTIAIITGGPMTAADALKSARFRWPDSEINTGDGHDHA